MSLALHIIPVGGSEPEHVAHSSCWCHPLRDAPDRTSARLPIWIHNAVDLREVRERHPDFPGRHPNGEHWVHVYGNTDEGELG